MNKKVKIAFAASRDLAVELIEWTVQNNTVGKYEIVGGIAPNYQTWWNDQVKSVYRQHDIPYFETIEDLIETSQPDIVFSINYWKIIKAELIKKVPRGIVNIHHSYKLRFRGRYTCSWAILHARKDNNWQHGTTLHYINENLDDGNIIASSACTITEDDTAETLFNKVEQLAIELFIDNFDKILKGTNDFIPADKTYFYYDADSNKSMEIDKNLPVEDIYDFVRAWSFKNRPKPYFLYGDKKIFLLIES